MIKPFECQYDAHHGGGCCGTLGDLYVKYEDFQKLQRTLEAIRDSTHKSALSLRAQAKDILDQI